MEIPDPNLKHLEYPDFKKYTRAIKKRIAEQLIAVYKNHQNKILSTKESIKHGIELEFITYNKG